MTDDNIDGEKPKTKHVKKKRIRNSAQKSVKSEMTTKMVEEGIGVVRDYRQKCRCFRQRYLDLKSANRITKRRILREFVAILIEMERESGNAANKLKNIIPEHKPLAQSDLVVYLAGRTTRHQDS